MGTDGDTQRDLGRIEGRVTGIVASLDHLNKRFDSFEATNSRRFEELTELLQRTATDQAAAKAVDSRKDRWAGAVRNGLSAMIGGAGAILASFLLHLK